MKTCDTWQDKLYMWGYNHIGQPMIKSIGEYKHRWQRKAIYETLKAVNFVFSLIRLTK